MCGRFRLARSKELLDEAFGAVDGSVPVGWSPRYNVAPGQSIVAVHQDAARPVRELVKLRWGLIPAWAKEASIGYKMINARAETAAEKPAFRQAMRKRRCLIPADGFYEWKKAGGKKLPYCFTMSDAAIFAFAGLWEPWRSPAGEPVESCTILTTEPNELAREIHDRMPVILAPEDYELWLDPGFARVDELKEMLKPYPARQMRRYRVSERVNQVKNDDPECAAEIEAA
jgi:putative SOS response-associated peptidase YedK